MNESPSTSPTAVVLIHDEEAGPGQLGPALRRAGFALDVRSGAPHPEDTEADLVVVMGRALGLQEVQPPSLLEEQRRLLARRLESGRPSLGIGAGALVLAAAAGARVHPGEKGPVLGVHPVSLTTEGLSDPLFAGFEEFFDVLHWQEDTFEPVHGAQVLASTARYPHQIFRMGHSYGVQLHPEVDGDLFERWVRSAQRDVARVGLDAEELLKRERPRLARVQQHAMLLMERLATFCARQVGAGGGERYLFTVETIQRLAGRGVLLSPGIPRRSPIVRVGQTISLKRPDGSRVEGTVRGMASFGETGAAIPLLVLLNAPDAEVPPGSEALTSEPLTV
ncbi:MAG TPA: type 1 glutamine amidotransferase [Archangium sp.]|jgi:GMP synthase (glutamine-hydrolysing)|uniref:type 1 glutamine amidotransferase n=1 Tax=Archangium sp. TaxID=1872627 RepID=UPI002ED8D78C